MPWLSPGDRSVFGRKRLWLMVMLEVKRYWKKASRMTISFPRKFVLWLAVWGGIVFVAPEGQADDAEAEQIEALEVALDEWLRDVSFYCDFTLKKGTARSLELARSGTLAPQLKPAQETITGLFARSGDDVRYRFDYGHPPKKVGTNELEFASFEELIRGPLGASYAFRRENHGGNHVMFFPRKIYTNTSGLPGLNSLGQQYPLSLMGSHQEANLLRVLDMHIPTTPPATRSLHIEDAEHLKVVVVKLRESATMTMEVVFWTIPEIPVVSRLTLTDMDSAGKKTYYEATCSDFVELPGGMLAGKVRLITGGYLNPRRWSLDEWTAKNLRPPEDSDFVMEAPELPEDDPGKVRFKCLEETSLPLLPVENGVRKIDLTRLTVDDLSCYDEFLGKPESDSGSFWVRLLSLIGLAVLLFAAIIFIRRRRHLAKA